MGKGSAVMGAVLAALALSCGGGPAAPLDRETFERVMVALREAKLETDSAGFAARRDEILRSAGVTDSMLLGFVRAHAADVDLLVDVWGAIDGRVNGPPINESDVDTLGGR